MSSQLEVVEKKEMHLDRLVHAAFEDSNRTLDNRGIYEREID